MNKPTPRAEIAAYIAEVEQPGIPYVSSSHGTLLHLNCTYGEPQVSAWLKDYFDQLRSFT